MQKEHLRICQLNYVPIVNENDDATSEIKYGDNDRLASSCANYWRRYTYLIV